MANYDIPDLTAGTVTRASMIEASILVNNAQKSRRTTAGAIADLANANTALEYDPTTSYAVGDYCMYDGVLKKCNTPTSGTALNPHAYDATEWDTTTVAEALEDISPTMELGDLDDVTLTSEAEGETIAYDATNQEWKNKKIVKGMTQTDYDNLQTKDPNTLYVTDGTLPTGTVADSDKIAFSDVSDNDTEKSTTAKAIADLKTIAGLPAAGTGHPASTDLIAISDGTNEYKASVGDVGGVILDIKTLTITNKHTNASVYAYKTGHIVTVSCSITAINGGSWVTVGIVSAPPKQQISTIVLNGNLSVFAQVIINAQGAIQMYHADSSEQSFYSIGLTYITDN